jgi:hypothetical protein
MFRFVSSTLVRIIMKTYQEYRRQDVRVERVAFGTTAAFGAVVIWEVTPGLTGTDLCASLRNTNRNATASVATPNMDTATLIVHDRFIS